MVARLIILLCIITLISSCDDDDECVPPYPEIFYPIIDTSSHWFETVAYVSFLKMSSSKGRSESYDVRSNGGQEYLKGVQEVECFTNVGEHRYLRYTSSLYDHDFYLQIGRNGYDDVLTIRKRPYDYRYYTIGLQNRNVCKTSISLKDTTLPVLWIDSMTAGSRSFSNVFKIDADHKKYSLDDNIKVIYFTPGDGVILFETFEGEVWPLY